MPSKGETAPMHVYEWTVGAEEWTAQDLTVDEISAWLKEHGAADVMVNPVPMRFECVFLVLAPPTAFSWPDWVRINSIKVIR